MTSISHPCPSSVHNYDRAIAKLTKVLDNSRINEVYTHHVDLLHHCIMCPDFSQNVVNQVLDLWLIESDGDIKPLLSFDCDKMFRRLLASRKFIYFVQNTGTRSFSIAFPRIRRRNLYLYVCISLRKRETSLSIVRVSISGIVILNDLDRERKLFCVCVGLTIFVRSRTGPDANRLPAANDDLSYKGTSSFN